MARINGTKDQLCVEALSIENEVEALVEQKSATTCSKVMKDAIDGRLKLIRRRLSALKSELKVRRSTSDSNKELSGLPHFDNEGRISEALFKNQVYKVNESTHKIESSIKISDHK
jgi:hypothetical protein